MAQVEFPVSWAVPALARVSLTRVPKVVEE